ncbi:MAG: hypothetical protein ACMUJM_03485 [bacterium]
MKTKCQHTRKRNLLFYALIPLVIISFFITIAMALPSKACNPPKPTSNYALYSIARDIDSIETGDGNLLREINPYDGSTISSVNIRIESEEDTTPVTGGAGLATDPTTGILWGILILNGEKDVRYLAHIDPSSGRAHIVYPLDDKYTGLAFDSDGNLYGMTGVGARCPETLFKLDKSGGTPAELISLWKEAKCTGHGIASYKHYIFHASVYEESGTPIFECVNIKHIAGNSKKKIHDIYKDCECNHKKEKNRYRKHKKCCFPAYYKPGALTYWEYEGLFLCAGRAMEDATINKLYSITKKGKGKAKSKRCKEEPKYIGDLDHISKGLAFVDKGSFETHDSDGDGVLDLTDNCIFTHNPEQGDCNGDDIGDACSGKPDCDGNGIPDSCEISDKSLNCDQNEMLDSCEIANDPSLDCDDNGMLDSCDVIVDRDLDKDCDGNEIFDFCDIANYTYPDCNYDGVPDNCQGTGATKDFLYSISNEIQYEEGDTMLKLYTIEITDTGVKEEAVLDIWNEDEDVTGGHGLALDASGTLWAILSIDWENEEKLLATIDQTTGEANIIGELDDIFVGLTFDSEGILYGVTGNTEANQRTTLLRINPPDWSSSDPIPLDEGIINIDELIYYCCSGNGIAFNPSDGLIYHVSAYKREGTRPDGIPYEKGNPIFKPINLETREVLDNIENNLPFNYHPGALTYWRNDGENDIFLWSGRYGYMSTFSLYSLTSDGAAEEIGTLSHRSHGLVFVKADSGGGVDDSDNDCVPDGEDNCPDTPNPFQENCGDDDDPGDACKPDCNKNGMPDLCEIINGESPDCNGNDIPDSCDMAEGTSQDCNGDGIPDECMPQCYECDGKVSSLTLRYNGDTGAQIKVTQKGKCGSIVFNDSVEAGGTFTFSGQDQNGTLGTEICIYVDGEFNTKIHTSCSQPIGPCMTFGSFTVVEGYSKNGGLLCPIVPSDDECGQCYGKVTSLTLQYNADTGAQIEVKQKGKCGSTVFNDYVEAGGTFTFFGQDKDGTLGTEIFIYVDGEFNTKIHTSCSQPIGPGMTFGSFTVKEGFSKDGGPLCSVR